MLRARTVFVIGAGGSFELGLPLGDTLRTQISQKMDLRFSDGYRMDGLGDREILLALKRKERDINPYLHECWKIRDGVILGHSIDNFIDAHRDNHRIEFLGKLAITKCILDAERESKIVIASENAQKNINFREVQDTYLVKMWRILQEGVPISSVDCIFENCSIITFNYDRCIEHFLYNALQAFYYVSPDKAAELVSQLPIHHVYGVVGSLPWQTRGESMPFGGQGLGSSNDLGDRLLALSEKIRTYTQQVVENTELERLRKTLQEAGVVVFLGFAYFKENLRLLATEPAPAAKVVYGTACGLSSAATEWVEHQLKRLFEPQTDNDVSYYIRRDLTCAGLLDEYARQLSDN